MAVLKELKTITDSSCKLTVLETEEDISFNIKRIFYIYDIAQSVYRGGHRHQKNIQALICMAGHCNVYVNTGQKEDIFFLNTPSKCLLLNPEDWHRIYNFSHDAVLLVLASEHYNSDDYIEEEYK